MYALKQNDRCGSERLVHLLAAREKRGEVVEARVRARIVPDPVRHVDRVRAGRPIQAECTVEKLRSGTVWTPSFRQAATADAAASDKTNSRRDNP